MIKLKNFSYSYGKHTVLQNIDLEISSGKVIAVIGQNGSGKSTLAQVLAGLRFGFSGEVWLDELRLKRNTPLHKIRQKTSIVFQNPDNQIIFQKVYDELEFVLENFGIEKSKQTAMIESALAKVGMLDHIQDNPHELSGGQRQRIVIATAILTRPKCLILDEATSMLDTAGRHAIYKIMRELKKHGMTTLLITNWLDEIMIADEVLILDRQKIYNYTREALLNDLKILERHGLEIPLAFKFRQDTKARKSPC